MRFFQRKLKYHLIKKIFTLIKNNKKKPATLIDKKPPNLDENLTKKFII